MPPEPLNSLQTQPQAVICCRTGTAPHVPHAATLSFQAAFTRLITVHTHCQVDPERKAVGKGKQAVIARAGLAANAAAAAATPAIKLVPLHPHLRGSGSFLQRIASPRLLSAVAPTRSASAAKALAGMAGAHARCTGWQPVGRPMGCGQCGANPVGCLAIRTTMENSGSQGRDGCWRVSMRDGTMASIRRPPPRCRRAAADLLTLI